MTETMDQATPLRADTLAPVEGPQPNIAIAGKYGASDDRARTRTRDWQAYFFFRVLTQAESDRLAAQIALQAGAGDATPGVLDQELFAPGTAKSAGVTAEQGERGTPPADPQGASAAFRNWLTLIASGTLVPGVAQTIDELAQSSVAGRDAAPAPSGSLEAAQNATRAANNANASGGDETEPTALGAIGRNVIDRGLQALAAYEIQRHISFAQREGQAGSVAGRYDPASINIGFTFGGLEMLRLDAATLRSFPEPFRDGMAARARRLGDTGGNAPDTWYGELGSRRIHGFFTGGFAADDVPEAAWKRLRQQIDAFNRQTPDGRQMRGALKLLFSRFGMEVMHIELGQAPYRLVTKPGEADGDPIADPILPRVEHFGFRDGISQPFVDMRIGPDGEMAPPPRGSGSPRRDRTWSPVAPGELYLDRPDEDGSISRFPANEDLRSGSTYLVFRKLAQDIAGFRRFLKTQAPGPVEAQERLAAQIVGRWKNGTSLIVSPYHETPSSEAELNDFLFAADDPDGRRCPLGAHVRRSNPRDIGGRNNVRRHRMMRRSFAYGGSLVESEDTPLDEERGLLFIAAMSRIDMQFEVVQGDWINGGEFLGQAGLGKCPLTGTHDGKPSDSFLTAGGLRPISGLPVFVTLRGGDYFFVPGLRALRMMADPGQRFAADDGQLQELGRSMGSTQTPELFSPQRLQRYIAEIASRKRTSIGVRIPAANAGLPDRDGTSRDLDPATGADIVFVGTHADVKTVLSSRPSTPGAKIVYTAAVSRAAGANMLRRGNLLVGTDWGHSTETERNQLLKIAAAAWDHSDGKLHSRIDQVAARSTRATVLRVAPSGRIDLVRDLASDTVYDVVSAIFGTPGPDYLTELAYSLPFGRRRVTELEPDWLMNAPRARVERPAQSTFKIWSFLVGLYLIGDFRQQENVALLARQAAAEAELYLDELIVNARRRSRTGPFTYLDALVAKEAEICGELGLSAQTYYDLSRSILFEMTLTATAIIPAAFGSMIDAVFDFGIDLDFLVERLTESSKTLGRGADAGVIQLIYELNRLRPALPLVIRYCESEPDAPLPSGTKIRKGQWVGALTAAANLDPTVFKDPLHLSLAPFLPSHVERKLEDYFMFGVQDDGVNPAQPTRTCWGRDRMALALLVHFVRQASQLPGLRRTPGPSGAVQKFVGITSGLSARFSPFTPD